ncbi:nuclease-related domain-containing protein [Pseudarthrobacter sp. S9]|uniref:nuclease-related domain-containing protein n=1 Tax=Pseudarthrobacter sp. S9 TaxID=3418421 RepID=UPI003D06394B
MGEIAVGRILARLGPEWTVLHAVPVGAGASDIDHVLIGPGGVFTLNTKNHSGQSVWVAGRTLMVAGKKQRHIANSVHEAVRAAKFLTTAAGEVVPVTGVLVIVDAKSLPVREKPADVVVVTDRQLLRWLNRRRRVLTPEQIAGITAAAILPTTWHRNPAPDGDITTLQQGFENLRKLVGRARRRRAAWALALVVVLVIVLANVVPMLAGVALQSLMHR